VTTRRLNRYEVIEIWWLSGIENFVSERDDFIFNSFNDAEVVTPMQGHPHRKIPLIDFTSALQRAVTITGNDHYMCV